MWSSSCGSGFIRDHGSPYLRIRFCPIPSFAPRTDHPRMPSGSAALRTGRHSRAGQRYLVTFTTAHRRAIFLDPLIARDTCRWLSAPAAWGDASLLAWVLMPDHWHGILQLGGRSTLSTVVGQAKGRVARGIRVLHPHIEMVWQSGFHDRALRSDADLLPAARYVVANPLRAGLVCRIGNYPYWDCQWLDSPDRG